MFVFRVMIILLDWYRLYFRCCGCFVGIWYSVCCGYWFVGRWCRVGGCCWVVLCCLVCCGRFRLGFVLGVG